MNFFGSQGRKSFFFEKSSVEWTIFFISLTLIFFNLICDSGKLNTWLMPDRIRLDDIMEEKTFSTLCRTQICQKESTYDINSSQLFFISFLNLAHSNWWSLIDLLFKSAEWMPMGFDRMNFSWGGHLFFLMFWPGRESNPGLLELDRWSRWYRFAIVTPNFYLINNSILLDLNTLLKDYFFSFEV